MSLKAKWLPECLFHLNEPYISDNGKPVIIGQVSSDAVRGYEGVVLRYTALVPLDRRKEVLSTVGGIGWEVRSSVPEPIVGNGEIHKCDFWIEGPCGSYDRLEPIVVSWSRHNKTAMMPDNGMLMCYDLFPRTLQSPDRIVWDDLSRPEPEVVIVRPLSHYDRSYSNACVEMNRDYLEDYASLKGCALVSIFFEERYCSPSDDLDSKLKGEEIIEFKKPGYRMNLRKTIYPKGKRLCQIWGCREILIPTGRPVSEESDPKLKWHGYPGIMDTERARDIRLHPGFIYAHDQVLESYEGRDQFEVNPLSGSISYDGWWSLTHSHRVGRDYIAYQLKGLYEGCPPAITHHVYKFQDKEAVAESNKMQFGSENIGTRAKDLIYALLELGDALVELSDLYDLPFQASDMIGLDREAIDYYGWWCMQELAPLGHYAPVNMTEYRFLERCKTIQKMLGEINQKTLRRLLIHIGFNSEEINYKSIKLLGTVLQYCQIADSTGLDAVKQSAEIIEQCDRETRFDLVTLILELFEFGNTAGHNRGKEKEQIILKSLGAFGAQVSDCAHGYGHTLDKVYDQIADSLLDNTQLIRKVVAENI